jgi:hypothetical protein
MGQVHVQAFFVLLRCMPPEYILRSVNLKYNLLNNRFLTKRKTTMGNDIETSELLSFATFSIVSNNSMQKYTIFGRNKKIIGITIQYSQRYFHDGFRSASVILSSTAFLNKSMNLV